MILIILLIANDVNNLIVDVNFLSNFLLILFICLIFNLLNKNFLGDSGSYIISFLVGSLLIDIYSKNQEISSLFVVLLLWYPAFEILFSMLRKIKSNISPMSPDTNHLHQLLFFFLKKKLNFLQDFKSSLVGITINLYNFIFLFISTLFFENSKFQLVLVVINIANYFVVYRLLNSFKKKFKH